MQRVLEDLVLHVTDIHGIVGEYTRDEECYEVFVTSFIHAMGRSLGQKVTGQQVVALWSVWLGFHGDDGPPEIMPNQYEIGVELRLAFDAYRSTP